MKLNAVINDTEKTILSRASLINRIIKLLKQYENDEIVKNITSYELSNIQTVTLILLIIKALEDDNPSMEVKDIVNVITDNLTEKMLAFEELTDTNTGIFTNNLVELNNSFFNDDKEIKLVNESFLSIIGIENHKLFKTKKKLN
jgi:HEAT repeat protein